MLMRLLISTTLLILALSPAASGQGRSDADEPNWAIYEEFLLDVKFREGTEIRVRNGRPRDISSTRAMASSLSSILQSIPGGDWRRLHSVSEEKLAEIRSRGTQRSGRALLDLELYERLTLPPGLNASQAKKILLRSSAVEGAYYVTKPVPPPAAPDYSLSTTVPYQGYLDAAPSGVNARFTWASNYIGAGISICDVEYDFHDNHVDLPGMNRIGGTAIPSDTHHATAVLSEILGLHNGTGVRGIAYGAGPNYFSPQNTYEFGNSVARAIVECIAALEAGDVLLMETQTIGPYYTGIPEGTQYGLVPSEWEKPVYDAVRAAVAIGIVVVEASGNGSQNLDDVAYSNSANNDHKPFLLENDSGAIIVTGGSSTVPHSDLFYSNYGATVDLQGWGENIVSAGYGSLYAAEGIDSYFSDNFGGSSGASPIVVGTVAILQSLYRNTFGSVLPPAEMRSLLRRTGTAGSGFLANTPLPDIRAAFFDLINVIYVDASATGANDGSSWTNAYTLLPSALAVASPGTVINVAEGTYWPSFLDGPRTDSFLLQNGVALLGGFPSGGWIRDPETYTSYLSGNIAVDANDSYHVVTGSGTDSTAILDGFTVSYARADGISPHDVGGGILIQNGSPTIRNTTFRLNTAGKGAGAYVFGGTPRFLDVTFSDNASTGSGGGLYHDAGTSSLNNVSFIGNQASLYGGGVFSAADILGFDLHFLGNSALRGGGLFNIAGSDVNIDNGIFNGNNATQIGGAIMVDNSGVGSLELNNVTIANNSAGGVTNFDTVSIKNSILWGNSSGQILGTGTTTVSNSIVEGGYAGSGNAAEDPLFRDADGADNIIGTADDDLRLQGESPAIDSAGSDCILLDINNFNRVGTCDKGAHEYLGDPGDFWSNGEVDSLAWGESSDSTLVGGSIRQSADDFVIPAGEACDINSVRMVLTDPTEALGATLEIYDDFGGEPTFMLATASVGTSAQESLGVFANARMWQYNFTITPLRLSAGTYWASVFGKQESAATYYTGIVSAGEGAVQGNPYQFRQVGFAWTDGGIFHGYGSRDLALDIDANCGCGTDAYCDDGDPNTIDTCSNLVCSNTPLVVTNALDDGSPGTLRSIIGSAESGGSITFDASLDGLPIVLDSVLGPLLLTQDVNLDASTLPNGLMLDGGGTTQILHVDPGVVASIAGLTITGGNGGNGGGIENDQGILSLVDVSLIANQASGYGGGIINFGGTLTMTNTTIAGNIAGFGGGGLYNGNSAATVSTLINSTVEGNNSNGSGGGGGIQNQLGEVNLIHTTIVGNESSASSGGGIQNASGTLSIENSIVAGNTAATVAADFFSNTTVLTAGQSLIGDHEGVQAEFPIGPFAGTALDPVLPMLGPLADNGGPTPTMLPLNGSPAIDAAVIEVDSPLADQRGILRPQGPNDDIGSVEVVPEPAAALQIISGALFLTLLSRRRRTNLLTGVRSAAATTSKGLRS
jgi:serine protease